MTTASAIVRDLDVLVARGQHFGVVYADPPWRFETRSDKGRGRAADTHYKCMTLDDIAALPVRDLAAKDSALWLWATAPMLPQALDVMKGWGFTYRSSLLWDKIHVGTGYWFRNAHELLLLGTRGNVPAPEPGTQSESIIRVVRGQHSAKPEQCRPLIERYFPTASKLELFGRRPARGWIVFGDQIERGLLDRDIPELTPPAAPAQEQSLSPAIPAPAADLAIPEFLRRAAS